MRPLLLDWGAPGAVERGFTLTDYVAGRLERALVAAARLAGGPVVLAGYCMGGLLALAAAQRRPELVRGLALLATPWDFWAEDAARARASAGLLPLLEPLLAATGTLPVDALQALFAGARPDSASPSKYRAFARLDPDSPRARRFVALEDWLNDGVAAGRPGGAGVPGRLVRRQYPGRAAPGASPASRWTPRALRLPAFLAIPARDRIVPPATRPGPGRGDARRPVHHAAAGHIGMVAGSGAEAQRSGVPCCPGSRRCAR